MSRTSYQIIPGDTSPYFLTLTTVNWIPIFNNPKIANIIFNSIKYLQTEKKVLIYAYVLMENHLHLIASSENLGQNISSFKSFTARAAIDYFQQNQNRFILHQLKEFKLKHRIDRKYQLWQEGTFPKQIQSMEMMRQKIQYIHFNPVRRGYIDFPEHWRYSSARNYANQKSVLDICKDW